MLDDKVGPVNYFLFQFDYLVIILPFCIHLLYKTSFQLLEGKTYPKPREINNNIPERLEKVILKALSRRPEDRYVDIKAFRKDLDESVKAWDEHVISYSNSVEPTIKNKDWIENFMMFYKEGEMMSHMVFSLLIADIR